MKKRSGLGEGGVGEGGASGDVADKGALVRGGAGVLVDQGYGGLLVALSVQGEVAVWVLVGNVLSVRGHDEALQGREVVESRRYGAAEYVVVVVGRAALESGKNDLGLA